VLVFPTVLPRGAVFAAVLFTNEVPAVGLTAGETLVPLVVVVVVVVVVVGVGAPAAPRPPTPLPGGGFPPTRAPTALLGSSPARKHDGVVTSADVVVGTENVRKESEEE